ncbi:MAG: FmdB family zinc ribbon protein [Desulfohalobiaceae bacterium]
MPIYEYVCNNCAKEFEELILDSQEQVLCPECGAGDARRMLSRCRTRMGGQAGSELSSDGVAAGGGGCGSCSAGSCASCG